MSVNGCSVLRLLLFWAPSKPWTSVIIFSPYHSEGGFWRDRPYLQMETCGPEERSGLFQVTMK